MKIEDNSVNNKKDKVFSYSFECFSRKLPVNAF